MMKFLRNYQRFFYLIITVVIVLSFTFFGTSGAITEDRVRDQVAFVDIAGNEIMESELHRMVSFLEREQTDLYVYGGVHGFNGLNDGVFTKDFIMKGIVPKLEAHFSEQLRADYEKTFEKEKSFKTYTHPEEKFINTESVWTYFAPSLKKCYKRYLDKKKVDGNWLQNRLDLILEQNRFPPYLLNQIMTQQQKQYNWITPDPKLPYLDLSLFGHHGLEDWLGRPMLELMAQFVYNGAALAKREGVEVTREEALADLLHNHQESYARFGKSPAYGGRNVSEAWQAQLRQHGLTEYDAVSLWQEVLYFRRLIEARPEGVVLDGMLFRDFNTFAKEIAEVDIYKVPKELRIRHFDDLKDFEFYLGAVAKTTPGDSLELPKQAKSLEEIEKETPSLIYKEFTVLHGEVSKEKIAAKAPIREILDWKLDEKNRQALFEEFPILENHQGEILNVIEALPQGTKNKIDAFARQRVLENNPDRFEKALEAVELREITLQIPLEGGKPPLSGISDNRAFLKALEESTGEPFTFAGNGGVVHKIQVVKKDGDKKLFTLTQANERGVLKGIVDRGLEAFFEKNRARFDAGKSFQENKPKVARLFFEPLAKKIYDAALKSGEVDKAMLPTQDPEAVAPYRLLSFVANERAKIVEAARSGTEYEGGIFGWKLKKETKSFKRSSTPSRLEDAFAMVPGNWSELEADMQGRHTFFRLLAKKQGDEPIDLQYEKVQNSLENDAALFVIEDLVQEGVRKGAFSLKSKEGA